LFRLHAAEAWEGNIMIVRSIRRITDDARHNAFTGACWFKGDLYISYCQSDSHSSFVGRIIVLRSRDGGLTWGNAAVVRGPGDTRDSHLYTDGNRLYAVGFCVTRTGGATTSQSGCAVTEDGDIWTNWTPYTGTGTFVAWRPQFYKSSIEAGMHYCAAYTWSNDRPWGAVYWYESRNGHHWTQVCEVHSGEEQPSECYLEFGDDGTAKMLMRCDSGALHPYLCTSEYPFEKWDKVKLTDITLVGPAIWTVGDDTYIGGRWCYEMETGAQSLTVDHGANNVAQTAIFRLDGTRPVFQYALPSGPRLDHSYMGVARHPQNPRRFALSFYSDAIEPSVGWVDQWTHPDIYWVDALFLRNVEFLRDGFLVSKLVDGCSLDDASCPDPTDATLGFGNLPPRVKKEYAGFPGEGDFVSLSEIIDGKPGIVYLAHDLPVEDAKEIRVHLGYDGPIKVWWNGAEVFKAEGLPRPIKDQTSLSLECASGSARLAIALDTNCGKATGIFARWEWK
jgi:hypothetical protein